MPSNRFVTRNRSKWRSSSFCEPLEPRRLLSTVADPVAQPVTGPIAGATASPTGYTPAQLDDAYGINNIKFGSVTGTGAGQTIAIIAAYDDPMFVSSTSANFSSSDLAVFDQKMGLPNPPSFKKVDEYGNSTSYPTTDYGWANEIALDVEWTHAVAPDANILLVEAYSAQLSDLIQSAARYATSVTAVSVVNMSFSVGEFGDETSYDSYLQTPSGHQGITVLAASGDAGKGALYPSASPDVVAVGSTALTVSGDSYVSETGYSDSGGGYSANESKPDYQDKLSNSSSFNTSSQRATPDVSIDGDPNTGVSVYDSFNGGGSTTPWYKVGGSSAAVVFWSGLIAIADQGRAVDNLKTLDGSTQTLPALYNASSSDFHDITSGTNGYSAGAGYDLVTGIGTPIANDLIPYLATAYPTPVTATKLAFAVQPSAVVAGNEITPSITVDVEGSDGSIFTSDGSAVTLSVSGGGATLGGTVTVDAVRGVATFSNVTVPTAGTYKLVASDSGLTTATSNSFTVTAAASVASSLSFGTQPSAVTAGLIITPSVAVDVLDQSGAVLKTDDSAVTIALANASTGATLGGTLTVNAIAGVATFNDLAVSTAGTYMLVVTDGSLTSATSTSFTVSAVVVVPPPVIIPVASQVVFGTEPASATAGGVVGPAFTVNVEDSSGKLISTDTSAVTLAIADGPAGATLGGTLTADAVGGVATFSDVTVSTAGSYTLTATDGSLTAGISAPFTVVPLGVVTPAILSSNLPKAVVAGAKLRGTVVVNETNAAVATTGPVTTNIYATAADGTQTLIGSVSRKLKLAPGKTVRISVPVTSTPASLDGTFTLTAAVVDPSGNTHTVASANTLTAAAPFTALTPAVTKLTLPPAIVAGAKLNAAAVVKIANAGNVPSTGITTVGIYASADGTLANASLLASVSKKLTVKSGGTANVSLPVRLSPASLGGTYQILAAVTGPDSVVTSSNSGSTVLIAPPTITFGVFSPSVSPGSVKPGKFATLTVTVENSGNIPATGTATIEISTIAAGATTVVPLGSVNHAVKLAAGKSTVLHLKFLVPATATAGSFYPVVAYSQDAESASVVGTALFAIS
jgi:hypothetical protein